MGIRGVVLDRDGVLSLHHVTAATQARDLGILKTGSPSLSHLWSSAESQSLHLKPTLRALCPSWGRGAETREPVAMRA